MNSFITKGPLPQWYSVPSRALGGITIKRFRRHNFCQLWQLVLNKPGALPPIILILRHNLTNLKLRQRQLSLLHSVISSDNKCLSSKSTSLQLQQRVQIFSASLPMCWNIISLIATEIGKPEQWKIQCKKAVALYLMNMFVEENIEISVRSGITYWSFTPGVAESTDGFSGQKGYYKGRQGFSLESI